MGTHTQTSTTILFFKNRKKRKQLKSMSDNVLIRTCHVISPLHSFHYYLEKKFSPLCYKIKEKNWIILETKKKEKFSYVHQSSKIVNSRPHKTDIWPSYVMTTDVSFWCYYFLSLLFFFFQFSQKSLYWKICDGECVVWVGLVYRGKRAPSLLTHSPRALFFNRLRRSISFFLFFDVKKKTRQEEQEFVDNILIKGLSLYRPVLTL